jgi:ABC-type antimicrobial peptide transport system permease subunit
VETEAGLRDLLAAFFGFAYVDRAQALDLSVNPDPNRISVALPEGMTADQVLRAADELNELLNDGSGRLRIYSVPRLIEQNQFIADVIGRFVVVMGLGAMLLGGVGIVNTMLVMVRRRTAEIAALKTFGVAGWQIAAMFMLEAALLGAIGSALGSLAGVGLSAFTTAYGEAFIQQPLAWRVYPEAILFGFGLGMVVTAIFGVLPVLTAVHVRPNIILRPNENHVVSLGVAQSLAALALVVVALGLIAGEIIGPIPALESVTRLSEIDTQPTVSSRWLGIAGVAGTLGLLGVLVGLLWLVVWGLGRLPALGRVELQLALRNLTVRRVRTATTLLALSAGMFALSSITFWGAGVREVLAFTLSDSFGGNVIALPLVATAQTELDARVGELDGLVYTTRWLQYDSRLMAVDGRGVARTFPTITVQDSDNPALVDVTVAAGRALTEDDRGALVALVRQTDELVELGVAVGSELTLRVNGMPLTVEVVGLLPDGATDLQAAVLSEILLPPGGPLTGMTPARQLNVFQVEADHVDDALRTLTSVNLVFAMDITFVDGVVSRFIDQFSALPTLVGILSLGAAGVIMANTVALATLERRRQIAVLKAIGLETDRVLRVMLLENLLVSLLGGGIGIGLSALGVSVLSLLGQDNLVLIPSGAAPVALVLVAAALVIGAMATFLSANFALRERVLNVLRYD